MPKFIALKNKMVRVENISLVELHHDTITVEMCGSMQMPVVLVYSNERLASAAYKALIADLNAIHVK